MINREGRGREKFSGAQKWCPPTGKRGCGGGREGVGCTLRGVTTHMRKVLPPIKRPLIIILRGYFEYEFFALLQNMMMGLQVRGRQ